MYVIYGIIPLGDAGRVAGFYANENCPKKFLVDDKEPKLTIDPAYAKSYEDRSIAEAEVNEGIFDPIPGRFYVLNTDRR